MCIIINEAFPCFLLPRQMKLEIATSSHLREKWTVHLSWTRYLMESITQNLKALFTLLQGRAALHFTTLDSMRNLSYGNMRRQRSGHTLRKNSSPTDTPLR